MTFRTRTRVTRVTRAASTARMVALVSALLAVLAASSLRLTGVSAVGSGLAAVAGLGLAVTLGALGVFAVARRMGGDRRGAELEASADGLRVDGATWIRAADVSRVTYAANVKRGGRASVWAGAGKLLLQFDVDGPDEVVAVQRALGLAVATGPSEHAVEPSWTGWTGAVLVLAIAAFVAANVGAGWLAAALGVGRGAVQLGAIFAASLGMGAFVSRFRARVGADGVAVTGRRFVPWQEVQGIETGPRGLVLRTTGGDVRLLAQGTRHSRPEAEARLRADLEDALAAHRRAQHADASARLERRDRSAEAWLASLRQPRDDFRTAALGQEQLEEIAADATSDPSARAAAALLLSRAGEGARLRIASERCAEPRLRVVLERAAAGEPLEAIEEAAAAVEPRARA